MRPYMTEAEAKKKWCPAARCATIITSSTGNVAVAATNISRNSVDTGAADVFATCKGSFCMMWGWRGNSMEVGRCEMPGIGG